MSAWRALQVAQIASLDQLKTPAAQIEKVPGIDPESASVIKDRLDRLKSKRTVQVRLIFPERPEPKRSSAACELGSRPRLGVWQPDNRIGRVPNTTAGPCALS